MTANPEKYQEDIEWLLQRLPSATEAQQEAFADKVAYLIADKNASEDWARVAAFAIIFGFL